MDIGGSKIFDNDNYYESKYIVIGKHHKLGYGILSYHIYEWHASYNKMMFNLDNGDTMIIPKEELNNVIMDIKNVYTIRF